jgi:5-methylcytosine-specific restriction endonuclease McrA
MVIQLFKSIPIDEIDMTPIHLGIDDGSKHVGIALVQECQTKNKPVFKGTIEQRQDVKHKMDIRRSYRKYKRYHKKYRKKRFKHRVSSKRKSRIAPSIKQKKQAVFRVVNSLKKWCRIDTIHLEDVSIDISSLSAGYKLYKWQYQKSNRLDENLRKATLMRDEFTCKNCDKKDCKLEAHHIRPKRLNGPDSIHNLITLCKKCHEKVTGKEMVYAEKFYELINGKDINFKDAMHVMQGKTYLREELSKVATLKLTTGGSTANKRIDWDIEKSHSNDALVVCDLEISQANCEMKDWVIKPMRKKNKAKVESVNDFKHRDYVCYTKRNGEKYFGYITALYPEKKQCNLTTTDGKVLKRYGLKSLKLIWRFNKIYWF